jgi:hypothetical protein
MEDIKEKLETLESVDGFFATGIVGDAWASNEPIYSVKKVNWKEICDISKKVLEKTKDLTHNIGISRPCFIHITLSHGNILVQRLKKTDDSTSETGWIVVFLGTEGNTALGKLRMNTLAKGMTDI